MLRALIQGNMPDCNGKTAKIWYDLSEFESGDEMAEKGCFAPFKAQAERIAQAEELWCIAALESDIPCMPASASAQSLDELIAIGRRWAELDKMDKAAATAYTRFIEKDVRKALDMAESGEYIIWTDCRTRADVARENYEEGLILEYLCPEYEGIVDWDAVADCYCGTLYRLDGATFIEFGEN